MITIQIELDSDDTNVRDDVVTALDALLPYVAPNVFVRSKLEESEPDHWNVDGVVF